MAKIYGNTTTTPLKYNGGSGGNIIEEDRLLSTGILNYAHNTLNIDKNVKSGVYIVPKNIDIVVSITHDNGDGFATIEDKTLSHTYNRTILYVENIQRTGTYGTISLDIVGSLTKSSFFIEYNVDTGVLSCEGGAIGLADQTYNPESENPQSGKAVAQAVADKQDKFADVLTEEKDGFNGIAITKSPAIVRASNGGLTLEGYTLALNSTESDYIYCSNKTLRYVGDPTEENEAATKGYVDRLIGDIDTALDLIIALQESIMGGE